MHSNPYCAVAFVTLLATSTVCLAGKSVGQCATEAGQTEGAQRQELIYECLSAPDPTPPPPPPIAPRSQHVYVREVAIAKVNTAGGVELYAAFVNPNKNSAIKYIRMSLALYNAVGDPIRSLIDSSHLAGIRFTGPLAYADDERGAHWTPVWYNGAAECIEVRSLSIEFMNGKHISFSGKSLKAALATSIVNSCRVK